MTDMTHKIEPVAATARRWPNATLRDIKALIATVGQKYVRVSSAALHSCKWGPYYGITRWRLVIGSGGYPVMRNTSGAARKERRSIALAHRDAEATGLPQIDYIGTPDPTRWRLYSAEENEQ